MFIRRCPLQDTLHSGPFESCMSDACPPVFVYVASLSTDIGFVCFAHASHFGNGSFLHGQPDMLQHEPSRFLSDTETAEKLVGTDSVLAVGREAHCHSGWCFHFYLVLRKGRTEVLDKAERRLSLSSSSPQLEGAIRKTKQSLSPRLDSVFVRCGVPGECTRTMTRLETHE